MEKRKKYAKSFLKEASKILTRNFKSIEIDLNNKDIEEGLNRSIRKIEAHIIGSIFNRYPIDSIYAPKTGDIKKSSSYLWKITPLDLKNGLKDCFLSISIENKDEKLLELIKFFPFHDY